MLFEQYHMWIEALPKIWNLNFSNFWGKILKIISNFPSLLIMTPGKIFWFVEEFCFSPKQTFIELMWLITLSLKWNTFYQFLIFLVYQKEFLGSPEYTHDVLCIIIVKNRLGASAAKPQHLQGNDLWFSYLHFSQRREQTMSGISFSVLQIISIRSQFFCWNEAPTPQEIPLSLHTFL